MTEKKTVSPTDPCDERFSSSSSAVIPRPWHVENVARLLVLCGSSLCYTVLASKAVSGRLLEVSRLIVYIILVRILVVFLLGRGNWLLVACGKVFKLRIEFSPAFQAISDMMQLNYDVIVRLINITLHIDSGTRVHCLLFPLYRHGATA